MRDLSSLLVAAILLLPLPLQALAAPGSSQDKAKNSVVKPVKKAETMPSPKNAKTYDFSADQIDGDRIGPGGQSIFGIIGLNHGTLIRFREHFINEVIGSTDTL